MFTSHDLFCRYYQRMSHIQLCHGQITWGSMGYGHPSHDGNPNIRIDDKPPKLMEFFEVLTTLDRGTCIHLICLAQ